MRKEVDSRPYRWKRYEYMKKENLIDEQYQCYFLLDLVQLWRGHLVKRYDQKSYAYNMGAYCFAVSPHCYDHHASKLHMNKKKISQNHVKMKYVEEEEEKTFNCQNNALFIASHEWKFSLWPKKAFICLILTSSMHLFLHVTPVIFKVSHSWGHMP